MRNVQIIISEEDFEKLECEREVVSFKVDFTKFPDWVTQKKICSQEWTKLKQIERTISGKWELDI